MAGVIALRTGFATSRRLLQVAFDEHLVAVLDIPKAIYVTLCRRQLHGSIDRKLCNVSQQAVPIALYAARNQMPQCTQQRHYSQLRLRCILIVTAIFNTRRDRLEVPLRCIKRRVD